MHLPAGLSGMCVRECVKGQSDHTEADLTHGWGDGGKPPVKECKAPGV